MIRTIKIDIYKKEIKVVIGRDRKKAMKIVNRYSKNAESMGEDSIGTTWCMTSGHSIIWLPDIKNVSTISHESTHAALHIFDHVGAKAESKNDEPFAYLVGFIVQKICAMSS